MNRLQKVIVVALGAFFAFSQVVAIQADEPVATKKYVVYRILLPFSTRMLGIDDAGDIVGANARIGFIYRSGDTSIEPWSVPITEPGQPRRWLRLWPVGLVMLMGTSLCAAQMWERYLFCRMMAEYHVGPEAKADGLKKAALHAWLKQWYQRAAIRPWLPVHPDRIPTGLE